MKVLHFAHTFFPVYGGTSTRLYNLLCEEKDTHYLYIAYPGDMPSLKSKEKYENFYIKRTHLSSQIIFKVLGIKYKNRSKYISLNSEKLLNNVEESDFDLVHGHNPLIFARAALKYSKKHNIPLIYEAHTFPRELHYKKKNILSDILAYIIHTRVYKKEKNVFKYASAVIVQTESVKQRIIERYNVKPKKIHPITMAVDVDKYDPNKWIDEGQKLRHHKAWHNKIVFMYNGYLRSYNGIISFLSAVEALSPKNKDKIQVVFLGHGPLKEMLEDKSVNCDYIDFLGLVNYHEMPKYYSSIDVLVSPRLASSQVKDVIPVKILEAMALEKIILSSDICAVKNLVKDGENGITFIPGNEVELREKIEYIINNYEDLDYMRIQARKDIIGSYNWTDRRNQLKNIYTKVIN